MMGSVHELLLVLSLLSFCRESLPGAVQRRLYHDLLKNYSILERPVQNESDLLTVEFGITPIQIMDLDEKNQVLTTNVWIQMFWETNNLAWNPKDYPGIRIMRFPNQMLWKPDIVLYNSADERYESTISTNILVDSSGSCIHMQPAIIKSTCKIDVRWFPFDEQRCNLTFGSWTHDGRALDLKMKDADMGLYKPNAEWDLVGVPGVRSVTYYTCCPDEPYPEISYTVILRRRTLYYGLQLLLPCLLISILALMVFLLPADSGQKITLGITVLVCLSVFMLLVAQIIPATSDTVPLISQYFAFVLVLVGLSLIATVIVLQFHHHDPNGSRMPHWTRVFLLKCAGFLWMKRGEDGGPQSLPLYKDLDSNAHSTATDTATDSGLLLSEKEEPPVPGLTAGVGKILKEVGFMAERFREQQRQEEVCNEWKFAAAVIDRLCLLVFSVLTIFCTIGILVSAPSFA